MVGAEGQPHPHIDHGVAGQNARVHGFTQAFFHGRNELARNHAALDFIDKFKALARFQRLHAQHHMAVLALATGLAHELAVHIVDCFANGFAVGHLGLAHIGGHIEFPFHAVDDDFQVQLAHAGNDGLARFLVGADSEGRVFGREARQCQAHFFLVGLAPGFHGLGDHGFGKGDFFEHDGRLRIAQRLARAHVLEAHAGRNVAGADFVDLLACIGMHLHDATYALLFTPGRVVDQIALGQYARVNAYKGQLAHEGVGHELEGQGGESFVIAGMAYQRGAGAVVLAMPFDGRNIERRGHELDNRIEQALHAPVLEGRAAEHGLNFGGDGAQAQAGDDVLGIEVAAVQVFLGQGFIGLGSGLHHFLAPFLCAGQKRSGDLLVLELHPLRLVVPEDGFHLDEVDQTMKIGFGSDGDDDGNRVGLEAVHHHLAHTKEIGAHAVHLVDEGQARHLVLVGLAPDGLRLWLHAAHGVVDHDCTVENAHGTLDLDGEVHVARGVDDVDAMGREIVFHARPEGRGGCRCDGDAAFLLLLHPVHGGSAVMDFAQLVVDPGIEQYALGGGGLAGIDMRGDADIAIAFYGRVASHDDLPETQF